MSPFLTLLTQSNSAGNGMLLGGGIFLVVIILIALASFAFWIWMLVDLLNSSRSSNEKLLWALVMFFTGILGSLLYLIIARGKTSAGPTL